MRDPTSIAMHSMPPRPDAADLAACRALLADGSRTFLAASYLLPRSVRDPACALYAFCRLADDAVDVAPDGDALARLKHRVACVYAQRPLPRPADRALAAVVARFAMPQALFDALLEGFEWDAAGRRYDSFDELLDYAARVAGTVGAMMALLMGVRSPDAVARACDLGVAMQLSNIARDVGEDARNGRVYLPLRWLAEAGIGADAWLARPRHDAALASVVRRLLREADVLYARVDDGIARLPLSCRPGINAARFLYAAIGHEVGRRGGNAVDSRAVVPASRKLRLLARALLAIDPPSRLDGAPALPATRFLVDAVVATPWPAGVEPLRWWELERRLLWVVELIERPRHRTKAAA